MEYGHKKVKEFMISTFIWDFGLLNPENSRKLN